MTAAKLMTDHAPKYVRFDRATISDAVAPDIDDVGGDYESGVIRNVAVITRGEALGHGMWVDQTMLEQVQVLGNENAEGVKARFTHPTMSSDGLGRALGRVKNFKKWGDKVIADLHFFESAHNTPEGDLAEYVMLLAGEDATAAGLSIVFDVDEDEQEKYQIENMDSDGFDSPDPDNVQNLIHARVAQLRAADVVDEPAANPEGMFHRQSLSADAGAFLSFVAGHSNNKPNAMFGVDPERARSFFQRWLNENELEISQLGLSEMNPEKNDEGAANDTREAMLAEHLQFSETFGLENGTAWFHEGLSFDEAMHKHCEVLNQTVEKLQASFDELQTKFDAIEYGETEPVTPASPDDAAGKKSFESMFNIRGSEKN